MKKIDNALCITTKDFDKIMEEKWERGASPTDRFQRGIVGICFLERRMKYEDVRKIKKVIIEPIWESENDG